MLVFSSAWQFAGSAGAPQMSRALSSDRPLPRVVTREKVSKSLNLFAARAYLDDFAPVPRQRHHSDKTVAAELPLMGTFQMV
jgi:hypothetical protein